MAQSEPRLSVIGVGAGSTSNGDTPELATTFANSYGLPGTGVQMIYDTSFESWRAFGVFSQPWWVLFDSDGNIVANQPGGIDAALVTQVVGQ